MRQLLIVAFLLHSFIASYSQRKDTVPSFSDSISQRLELSRQKLRELQDSMDRQIIQRSMDQNGKNLERFLADMKAQKEKQKRRMYIRIALGVLFLAVLIIGLRRRRKKTEEHRLKQ